MKGTVIENLCGRKLAILTSILLVCQLFCFLIGLIAPAPENAQNILATICRDTSTAKNDTTKWYYNRGKGSCKSIDLGQTHHDLSETDIVFAFQMPVPRESKVLDYSRWQQKLVGVLQVDIKYHSQMEVLPRSSITIDARLAYRNKGDPEDKWTLYTQSVEKRLIDCEIDIIQSEEHLYNCSAIPLFELGSLFHDYYLLNVRLPDDTPNIMNSYRGHIQDMWLTVINQNGGFIKVWLSLKTAFFPCILGMVIWFWRRIHMLQRQPVLLEHMLLTLGLTLCLLDLPIEYLTLLYDLPFMLLVENIRQDIFYAALFSFWLVYVGEHMSIGQTSAKKYCWHVIAVVTGCGSLLIYDICVRSIHLMNPFNFGLDTGIYLALFFIILTVVYFLFLFYMVFVDFIKISQPMHSDSGLNDEGNLYRIMFLMLSTMICATLTVVRIIFGQLAESQEEWEEIIELFYTSAYYTGVYGTWNIYVFVMLFLNAPSEKIQHVELVFVKEVAANNAQPPPEVKRTKTSTLLRRE